MATNSRKNGRKKFEVREWKKKKKKSENPNGDNEDKWGIKNENKICYNCGLLS